MCLFLFSTIFFCSFCLQQFLSVPGSHRYTHFNNKVHFYCTATNYFVFLLFYFALLTIAWKLFFLEQNNNICRRRCFTLTNAISLSSTVPSLLVQSVTMDTSYHQQPPQGVQSTGYNNNNTTMNCQTSPIQSQYQQQQQQTGTTTIHGSHGNLSNVSSRKGWDGRRESLTRKSFSDPSSESLGLPESTVSTQSRL